MAHYLTMQEAPKKQYEIFLTNTPKQLGYFFPAEWYPHRATWLSWPHNEASWPGKIESIYDRYVDFIKAISEKEMVHINVNNVHMQNDVTERLQKKGVDLSKIQLHIHPTNDAWCRDHGPAFLINPESEVPKIVIDWQYNAWGGKYPPYDLDDNIPTLIARYLNLPVLYPGIVMEGGSVDFNGQGTILTTTQCLLNKNRNPHLNQKQIEQYLEDYYGVSQVLWLHEGIVGDDTDGHIDDITRFVNEDTVITMVEENKQDENYHILQKNLKTLRQMRLLNGKQLNIIEIPMPQPVIFEGQRLPASYANFYISNAAVVMPGYRCKNDDRALKILEQCFPDRKVICIDSTDIIWGLGSFHCLSQQEPVSQPATAPV
jgi:agmatine deiminase